MRCGRSGRPTSRRYTPRTAPGWAPSTSTRCATRAGHRIAPALKQRDSGDRGRNFYSEGGIDPKAIVRASWRDLLAGGKPVQGGSTITQQLVRDLYIKHPSDTLKRKIVEAHLADEENARYSKASILTQYLNTAPYGTNGGVTAVGVQAAAETYFSKPASRLTLREAALLAGLPQAPSEYNPLVHPRPARARRNEVLRAMRAQGYISARQLARAVRAGLGLHPSQRYTRVREPYVFDLRPPRARASLRDRHGQARRAEGVHDDPAAAAGGRAARGRRVRGVLPGRWARVGAGVGRSVQRRDRRARLQPALLADSQFNFAAQAHRQPGSSFKTFVLTTAIKQGIDPDSTYSTAARR